jgi:transcriptional regulator with XRE-family HTH domain
LDQKKIGALLKKLRNENGLTQEQFAEIVMVSNRTVSRWENGNNLPDLDILLQISDYYKIDLRELLDGERKSENINKGMEENLLMAVEYTNCETERYTKRVHWLLFVVAILWAASQLMGHTGLVGNNILNAICDFSEGAVFGMVICGLVVTGHYGQRIKAFKQRLLKRQGGQQL